MQREGRFVVAQAEYEWGHRAVQRRFEISAARHEDRRCRQRIIDLRLVRPRVQVGTKPEAEWLPRFFYDVGDDGRVLQTGHEQPLLDGRAIELVGPDR